MANIDIAIMQVLAEEGDKYAEELFRAVKDRASISRPTFYNHLKTLDEEGFVERVVYGSAKAKKSQHGVSVLYRFVEPVPGFLEALQHLEARIPDLTKELHGAGNVGAMESVMKEVLGPSFLLVFLSIGEEGRQTLLKPYLGPLHSRQEIDAIQRSQAKVQRWMDLVARLVLKRIAPVWKKITPKAILAALRTLSPDVAQILARAERG